MHYIDAQTSQYILEQIWKARSRLINIFRTEWVELIQLSFMIFNHLCGNIAAFFIYSKSK